jgi:hypothetical protein
MTSHNTHTLKHIWFHHKPHTVKRTDGAVSTIVVGLCIDLALIYIWSFYLYASLLLP